MPLTHRLDWPRPSVCFSHRRGQLKVGEVAFATFCGFAPIAGDANERGGFLIGRIVLGTCDLVIDTVTPPMRGDIGTRTTFFLNAPRHQPVIDAHWSESDCKRGVLGTWHTHDEDDPRPSTVDEEGELKRLALGEYGDGEGDEPPGFLVIVGRRALGVWEVTRAGLRLSGKTALPPPLPRST